MGNDRHYALSRTLRCWNLFVSHLSSTGYSTSNKKLVLTPVRRRFPSFDQTRLLQWLPRGRAPAGFLDTGATTAEIMR